MTSLAMSYRSQLRVTQSLTITGMIFIAVAAGAPVPQAAGSADASTAEALIKGDDCGSCHAATRQVVGPSYSAIAARYATQAGAVDQVAVRIREGSSGVWGRGTMPAHAKLSEAQSKAIASWILTQKDTGAAQPATESTYSYTLKDGSTVKLEFPIFIDGKGPKVTKEVFHGYQLYNSYCYRCHGTDATGGQLAPDLRHSLAVGMKAEEFLSIAMTGKAEKGMPGWAGFLSESDVTHVLQYVKGRSLDLIPSNRPASAQD